MQRRQPTEGDPGRLVARAAVVDEHEASSPVRGLGLADGEAAVAEEGRLLVSGNPADRHGGAQERGVRDDAARRHDARQEFALDSEQREKLIVPVERREIEKHGPGGVRHIDDVRPTAGELPDEPRVHGSEEQVPPREFGAFEDPLELRRREVRVRDEAGPLPDQVAREFTATRGRTPVLPDDGALHRSA